MENNSFGMNLKSKGPRTDPCRTPKEAYFDQQYIQSFDLLCSVCQVAVDYHPFFFTIQSLAPPKTKIPGCV